MATMSNQVRFFSSDMPDSPTLSGTAGSLIEVMDACLVNGFGSRSVNSVVVAGGVATVLISAGHPFAEGDVIRLAGADPEALNDDWRIASTTADSLVFSVAGLGIADGTAVGTMTVSRAPAGWEKLHAAAGKAAYRSLQYATHNGMICHVDDSGATTATWRGYESMSGIDVGTDPFPNEGQQAVGLYLAKSNVASTSPRKWAVVADAKRIVLLLAFSQTYPNQTIPYVFGRAENSALDPWACFINGFMTSSAALQVNVGINGLPWTQETAAGTGKWAARDGSGVQKSVEVSHRYFSYSSNYVSGNALLAPATLGDSLMPCSLLACTFGASPSTHSPRFVVPAIRTLMQHVPDSLAIGLEKIGVSGNGFLFCRQSGGLTSSGLAKTCFLVSLGRDGKWD